MCSLHRRDSRRPEYRRESKCPDRPDCTEQGRCPGRPSHYVSSGPHRVACRLPPGACQAHWTHASSFEWGIG
eukprot:6275739-Alexandrium_andersonii.AAC.1